MSKTTQTMLTDTVKHDSPTEMPSVKVEEWITELKEATESVMGSEELQEWDDHRHKYTTVGENGEEAYESLKSIGEQRGYKIVEQEGVITRTNWEGTIFVKSIENKAHQALMLAHEIAHEILHDSDARNGGMDEGVREVEAESAGYVVARHLGLKPEESKFYIGLWIDDSSEIADNSEIIEKQRPRIRDAAQEIIAEL